jgi:hypothetical protein
VQAASDDLAKAFNLGNNTALFLIFMVAFGFGSRYVHGRFCVKRKHRTRMLIASLFTIASFLLIAVAC